MSDDDDTSSSLKVREAEEAVVTSTSFFQRSIQIQRSIQTDGTERKEKCCRSRTSEYNAQKRSRKVKHNEILL